MYCFKVGKIILPNWKYLKFIAITYLFGLQIVLSFFFLTVVKILDEIMKEKL